MISGFFKNVYLQTIFYICINKVCNEITLVGIESAIIDDLYPVMVCRITHVNKGFWSRFSMGSRVRYETLKESRKTLRPKSYEYNNEYNDKDNCPIALNNKYYKASS